MNKIKIMNELFLKILFFVFFLSCAFTVFGQDNLLKTSNERKNLYAKEIQQINGAVASVGLDLDISKIPARIRNPFVFGDNLSILNVEDEPYGYVRSTVNANIPSIELLGIIQKTTESSDVALIKINNSKAYLVKEGDEVSYEVIDPTKVVKIKQIDPLKIIVELGQLGSVIVVR